MLKYFFDTFFFLDHETSLLGIRLDVVITVVSITPIVAPVICHFKRRVDFGLGLDVLVRARGARDWDWDRLTILQALGLGLTWLRVVVTDSLFHLYGRHFDWDFGYGLVGLLKISAALGLQNASALAKLGGLDIFG